MKATSWSGNRDTAAQKSFDQLLQRLSKMLFTTEMDSEMTMDFVNRPKRIRLDSGNRNYNSSGIGSKSLELKGVIDVLKEYEDYDGGINCSICGKLYKSRVCFIKHIWEHSIYWDQFDGAKNHDRVLSIQAALILYSGYRGLTMDDNNVLSHLLVTSPHQERKKDDNGNDIESPVKTKTERRQFSPLKRKKSEEE